jgi:hypothetical protein
MCRITLSLLSIAILLVPSADASADSPAVRSWKIEYLRNGKWSDSAVFDTRQEAQAKLEDVRKTKRSTKPGVVARIVPTDWTRYEHLGALSAKYESGGHASGTVSTGKGDTGGVSYGTYQLSSKVGTAQRFADQYYADWFHGTKPGSDEFSAFWKQLAAEREPELAAFEHFFIADSHYQPFADRLQKDLALDLNQHSAALRDVAWSVAVQHGAGNKIFARALEQAVTNHQLDKLSEQEIIERIYAERGRIDANGVSVYFSKSSPQVQKSVLGRFKSELQDALKALAAEPKTKPRRR